MTNLTNQRRLAAQVMKIGRNRVWIDPQRIEDVESAITREEVRKLVHEKVIAALPIQGVSRGRAKVIQAQKQKVAVRVLVVRVVRRMLQFPRRKLG